MNPWLVGVIAGCIAIPVAILLRRKLRTAAHRRDDELDTPMRHHPWLLIVLPLAALLVGRALAESHNAGVAFAYCACLPVLTALTAIDLDVHRLPDALTFPLAPAAAVIAAVASVSTGHWFALLRAVLAGMALGAAYLMLLLISRGGAGLGLGDVKLAVGLGILLGWFSWSDVLSGTLIGFILGGLWAAGLLIARRATRHTYIAFGPFMIGGTVIALLAS
ncbi:prepilin peptidase [Flexivirga alba]|uniref:Prepilin peptidase n=1 Tax=Flexivirga alba TaxID=702742 RepID=A0ABW2AML0_9MICO